jgi:predicted nucleic acid-binding protein
MAVYFLDASALVKRYVAETGSAFVARMTDPALHGRTWMATIGAVELVSALYGRVNTGSISVASARQAEQLFRSDLYHHFASIDLSPSILSRAMGLARLHVLRAYDAIQLAAVMELRFNCRVLNLLPPTLISADQKLNQAALAEGLLVDDPNGYP